jgi:xylulokinase
VDRAGRPLHPALTWMDRRATAEAADASAAVGFRVDSSFNLPKALWFMRRRPDIYEATEAFMSCPEFLCRALTGESRTIVPASYEKYYGDAGTLAALGLDASKFPPFVRPGFLYGPTTAGGEEATGIPRGTKVVACGPDFLAALIGTATTRPGRACDRAGTSEGINLCAREGTVDGRLLSVPHIIEPYTNVSGTISSSGKAVDWFKRASGRASEGYEDFFEDICQSQPGAEKLVFLPYLSGERAPIWDSSARGVFIGLTLAHGRKEMSRAVVESTAYAMRDIIEVMGEAGASVSELRVTGSPGKSPVWNQIKADVTGRPIALPAFEDAELLGDLCFGLAALGRQASLAEAAEALVRIARIYEPDPTTRDLYDELFGVYRDAYRALEPVFKRLGRVPTIERSATQ